MKKGDDVFLTEAQNVVGIEMKREGSQKIRTMLRSLTSEAKGAAVIQDRKLVFSNCEVEHAKKSRDKYAHCKALFNMNK